MGEFRMPSLGADMEVGTIVEWRVAPGDTVKRGDVVAVVDTEKSTIDVEVFEDGIVEELLVEPGVEVAVGTPLATIAASTSTILSAPVVPSAPAADAAPVVLSPLVRHLAEREGVDLARVVGSGAGGRVLRRDVDRPARRASGRRATPRARRLARELGVDLPEASGAVTGDTVLRVAQQLDPAPGTVGAEPDRNAARRQAIARLVEQSHRDIPHYWADVDIDVENELLRLEASNADRSVRDRVLPIAVLLRAVVVAAERVPDLNGWWESGAMTRADGVDLGVVVSLRGGGLIVPCIADAHELDVPELMAALRASVERARTGALRSSDLKRPSISVTNLGDHGVDRIQPLILPPQVAMVGIGAIAPRPVVRNGMLGAHRTVSVCVAADHRASDGATGAAFLRALAHELERSSA